MVIMSVIGKYYLVVSLVMYIAMMYDILNAVEKLVSNLF